MSHYNIPTQRQTVITLTYPGLSALDLVGAQQILCRMGNAEVRLVWKTKDVISTDTDIDIRPSDTFGDVEDEATILFVPGGSTGVSDVIGDDKVLDYLVKCAKKAKYIASTGSGSLILGAAGLLTGYKAAGHWTTRDLLAGFGAHPVEQRIVTDRNRVTAAGCTGSIDFALHLVTVLRNANMAAALALANEYAPQVIHSTGTPRTAPQAVTEMEWAMNAGLRDELREAIESARIRRKV